jgi:hypothetical protein
MSIHPRLGIWHSDTLLGQTKFAYSLYQEDKSRLRGGGNEIAEDITDIDKLPQHLFHGLELACFACVYPVDYIEKPRLHDPGLSDLTAIQGNLFRFD